MTNRIIIGNRRYSSWSMRGWLAVTLARLDVETVVIPLGAAGTPVLDDQTPAGLVPVLEHDGLTIWDSLAIAEYCAEQEKTLWPAHPRARAIARSVAAEMHSGFAALRRAMPMNLGRAAPLDPIAEPVLRDLSRIQDVWRDCLDAHGGPYLFGDHPTIADVMYAPVVARVLGYRPPLTETAQAYCRTMRAQAAVDAWYRDAANEPDHWRLAKYE